MGLGGRSLSACVAFGVLSHAAPAPAADFEVTGDIAAQGYDVASPFGDVVVGRRRLTSTLGLAVFNIEGDREPFSADYSVKLRMRLDADFGIDGAEQSFDPATRNRFVPGLNRAPVDLMYGYAEGRDLGGGWLDFRVGRQYVSDVLGWWSFDGALVRLKTPYFVNLEAYGGLEQRGGLPLSTSRFEPQGVWRGSHGGFEDRAQDYPSFQFAAPAPAFGVALEPAGPQWLQARLTYRRVYNTGDAFAGQFPSPGGEGFQKLEGLRTSSERLGYAASAFLAEVGAVRGGVGYDFYNQRVDKGYATIEGYPIANHLVVGADFDYFVPTFDADSIWNWFTHNPVITALGRIAAQPTHRLELTASGGARLWMADGDPETYAAAQCAATGVDPALEPLCRQLGVDSSRGGARDFSRNDDNRTTSFAPDLLVNAGARYRWGTGSAGFRGTLETGFGDVARDRGRRVGGALRAKQALVGGLVWLGGRVSVYDWEDPLRDDRDATSFGYVVSPEYRPWEYTRFRVEWEHETNRLVGNRFRILGLVRLWVMP